MGDAGLVIAAPLAFAIVEPFSPNLEQILFHDDVQLRFGDARDLRGHHHLVFCFIYLDGRTPDSVAVRCDSRSSRDKGAKDALHLLLHEVRGAWRASTDYEHHRSSIPDLK